MANKTTKTMTAHVKEWKESGMTISEYAQVIGVTKSKFGYWVRKMKVSKTSAKTRSTKFIELNSLAEDKVLVSGESKLAITPKPQIELTFPSGLCLKIYS